MSANKDHSDPLWDTRRKRLDLSLAATFAAIFLSIFKGAEIAAAIAPAAFIAQAGILGWYFWTAGKEAIARGTVTTETETYDPPATKTVTKTEPKTEPIGEAP